MAEFYVCSIHENAALTGEELLVALRGRYGDQLEQLVAKQGLKKIVQKKDEKVDEFAERIEKLFLLAFPGESIQSPGVQSHIVEAFIYGLSKRSIHRKLISQHPQSLQAAIESARAEDRIDVELRLQDLGEEPMEVGTIALNKEKQQLLQMVSDLKGMVQNVNQNLQ